MFERRPNCDFPNIEKPECVWGLMEQINVTPLFLASTRNQLMDRHRSQTNGNKILPLLLIKLLEEVV